MNSTGFGAHSRSLLDERYALFKVTATKDNMVEQRWNFRGKSRVSRTYNGRGDSGKK
ncbi:MAG: hypothetical protein NVSMB31_02010 [Vulcanimicrobiaceae bacterium]